MVTSEAINDRLTRLEERFDATTVRHDGSLSRVWKGGIAISTVVFALLVDAVRDGFDLASIASVVGG